MTKPHETWTVAPHGPLEKLGHNLYTVTGRLEMPLGETTRRMTVARLAGGELVIFSPISLAEPAMQQLEAIGPPRYMIVPRGNHRLDLKPWKQRYPNIVVVAPEGVKADVEEVIPVDHTTLDTGDPNVLIDNAPGTAKKELTMMVTTETGKKTLAVADLIFNIPEKSGVEGVAFKVMGMNPGHPSLPWTVKLGLVKDEAALKVGFEAWSRDPELERILPAHGGVIENPKEILRSLAGLPV
ncbi:MAG TPA: hypothetical protein VGM90_27565 [Kofleriaceae bacterium]|jgi:hypothetical protein